MVNAPGSSTGTTMRPPSRSSLSSSLSMDSLPAIRSVPPSTNVANQTPSTFLLGSLKARKKMLRHSKPKRPLTSSSPLEEREVDGIVYQSRVKILHSWNFTNAKERWQAAAAARMPDEHSGRRLSGLSEFITHGKSVENTDVRSRCAESLYKLSKQVGTELMIIKSGAVQHIADFCDVDDAKLQAHCAATLANLTATTSTEVLSAFVANDGIPVVLETSWSPSFQAKVLAATTLCRLSCHADFTKHLYAAKAVIELSNMLSLPHPPLQKLCIQTLVNMICHGAQFHEKLFCGGGSVGQNKLGVVLAVSQLAQEPTNGRFVAEVIYNMSLFSSSAAGAIRGGIGEVLYYLIQAPHTTNSLARLLTDPSPTTHSVINSDQMAISTLIAMALGHFSKYLDLQLLLGVWSVKVVQHFLFLFDTLHTPAFEFVLPPCARVLANLSANDEYMATMVCGNDVLLHRLVLMQTWAKTADVQCQQNAVRSIANLTRCPLSAPQLVRAHILPVLNQVLHLPASAPVVSMKEDALVALINLACYKVLSEANLLELDFPAAFNACFRDAATASSLRYTLSLALCYLAFDAQLRHVATADLSLLIDALLFGFHYVGPKSSSSSCTTESKTMMHLRHREALDAFDDVTDGASIRFRFLAAMCNTASEIDQASHVEALVRVVLECIDKPNVIPVDHGFGPGAVEYLCAGILFALSKTTLLLLRRDNVVAEWTSLLFAPRVQAAVFRLSRGLMQYAPSPLSSPVMNVQAATQAYCTGTLYHMCAAKHTTDAALLALVDACNSSEDSATLLACASTFAIVSSTAEGRNMLLTTNGLAHALNKLGRTSACQQYAAVAACNVAITGCMWNAEELKDFVVVALLRSNSSDAIQVHAKTLYNLLSHQSSREQVINDGALYAFLKLAQLQTNGLQVRPEETLALCFHALFNLSDAPIYHDTILKLGVSAFLLSGVSGRRKRVLHFLNPESRRHAVGLLCNLSARETNHKDLIHNAQVTDLLRCLCDGDAETRASGAMTLRNLTVRVANAEVCTRNALNLLLVFLTSSHDTVRRLAAQAIGNCSLVTELFHLFLELQVGNALVQALESDALLTIDTKRAILQTLHNLAIDDACAVDLLNNSIIARWNALPHLFQEADICAIVAATCHILSRKPHSVALLAGQNIVALCCLLSASGSSSILRDCLGCLAHLSTHLSTHAVLFETDIVTALCRILDQVERVDPAVDESASRLQLYTCAVVLFRNLSLSAAAENAVACEQLLRGVEWLGRIVRISTASPSPLHARIYFQVCVSLANLCRVKRARPTLVSNRMVHVLLDIHKESSSEFAFARQSSTVTLHKLAAEDTAALEPGLIEALLSVLDHSDTVVHQTQREESKVCNLDKVMDFGRNHVEPLVTSTNLCRQTYRDVKWVHYVVEPPRQLDPSFDGEPKGMAMYRIRGPLPAVQDDNSGETKAPPPATHVLFPETNKFILDTGDDETSMPALDPRPNSPLVKLTDEDDMLVKKFDQTMKITRKQSRRGYSGPITLPQLKSELQDEEK
ncbi:hypothetical protein Ae201684P_018838 [Aphanomyces euteiches]|nr:hypothetical protein Ae201684P_018838 [Aphanomyces euteiches]